MIGANLDTEADAIDTTTRFDEGYASSHEIRMRKGLSVSPTKLTKAIFIFIYSDCPSLVNPNLPS